jgi:hypothetical protein
VTHNERVPAWKNFEKLSGVQIRWGVSGQVIGNDIGWDFADGNRGGVGIEHQTDIEGRHALDQPVRKPVDCGIDHRIGMMVHLDFVFHPLNPTPSRLICAGSRQNARVSVQPVVGH